MVVCYIDIVDIFTWTYSHGITILFSSNPKISIEHDLDKNIVCEVILSTVHKLFCLFSRFSIND